MLYLFCHILKWIGIPKPCLRRFRLTAGAFLFGEDRFLFINDCLSQCLRIFSVLIYWRKYQIAPDAMPCRKMAGSRPELSYRPDWWAIRCPAFAKIRYYIKFIVDLVLYLPIPRIVPGIVFWVSSLLSLIESNILWLCSVRDSRDLA